MEEAGGIASWSKAKTIVSTMGEVPPVLRRAIKELHAGEQFGKNKFLVNLMEQPLFKGPVRGAVAILNNSSRDDIGSVSDLLKSFASPEIAALVTVIYLSGRAKLVAPEAWALTVDLAQTQADVGVLLGKASGAITMASGLLIGPMRMFAYQLMARDAPGVLKQYRTELLAKCTWCNPAQEYKLWGCTNIQVASQLLAVLGYPSILGRALYDALSVPLNTQLEKDINRLRVCAIWTDCLSNGFDLPEISGEEEFLMEETKMDQLLETVAKLRTTSGMNGWMRNISPGPVSPG